MKNLRTTISNRFDRLDNRWRALPVKKQHRYTLFFFLAYVLLTVAVITGIWYDVKYSETKIPTVPIKKPIIKE